MMCRESKRARERMVACVFLGADVDNELLTLPKSLYVQHVCVCVHVLLSLAVGMSQSECVCVCV